MRGQTTLDVSTQEFPGLENGLEGNGKLQFRVKSVEDGIARLEIVSLSLENGNLADKRFREMSGESSQSNRIKEDDSEVDDI